MSQVFLAYDKEDGERAKALSDALERRGWTVDLEHEVPLGMTYDAVVEPKRVAARCVIALWSTHSVKNRVVRDEANDALEHEKLIPVLIESVDPPVGFRGIGAAHLENWHGELDSPALKDLGDSISRLIGAVAVVEAASAGTAVAIPHAAPRLKEMLADLSAHAKEIASVVTLATTLWAGVTWVVSLRTKHNAREALAFEAKVHPEAIRRNIDKLPSLEKSLIAVALDSINRLVKGNPEGVVLAYPGVIAFMAQQVPHRAADAKTCAVAPNADAAPPAAIDRAVTFLRDNKRGPSPDSVDLGGIVLPGANFRGADLRRVNLEHACLAQAHFDGAVLDGASFRGAALQHAYFNHATGKNVYFNEALLDTATFTQVNIDGAHFGGAVLSHSGFQAATLPNANFKNAKLDYADFTGAMLANAMLAGPEGADQARITGVRFDDKTKNLPVAAQTWLHQYGACFDTLVLPTSTSSGRIMADTACQCAIDPARACRARRPR